MKDQEVAIVVMTHQWDINAYETISLNRIFQVLGHYPIFFCRAPGLLPNFIPPDSSIAYFDPAFFKDIRGYNKLLTSEEFYAKFLLFKYILIVQLDTFFFKDDLIKWCKKDYDYIGAPWMFDITQFNKNISNYYPLSYKNKFLRALFNKKYLVGNGGLSLRKVRTFHDILSSKKYERSIENYHSEAEYLLKNNISEIAGNEDNFWCFYVQRKIKRLKIPNYKIALEFSFETAPELCFQTNQNQLPFGCHAWEKHGLDFWRPIFKSFGYEI